MDALNMYFSLKIVIFHCYVSLLEGKYNPKKLDNFTYYPYINPCCLASVA